MNDLAEAIKRRLVDVLRVAELLGLKVRREGATFKGRCPVHGDRTASCSHSIGPDGTYRVRCFGCGFSGDVLTLIAAVRGLDVKRDFPEVLRAGCDLAGLTYERQGGAGGDRRPPAPPVAPRAAPRPEAQALAPGRLEAMLAPLLHIGRLDGSALVRDVETYLDRRGLLAGARADGWAALPPAGPAQASWCRMLCDNFERPELLASGLVRETRGALVLTWSDHRLLIPWRGPDRAVCFYQRRLIGKAAQDAPKYVGPTSIRSPWPYGVEALSTAPASAPIAFVEGAVDVPSLRALDELDGPPGDEERFILGVPGGEAWRVDWAELARGRVVYIATDADPWDEKKNQPGPGDRYAVAWARDLRSRGATRVIRARPVGAKDWSALLEQRLSGEPRRDRRAESRDVTGERRAAT